MASSTLPCQCQLLPFKSSCNALATEHPSRQLQMRQQCDQPKTEPTLQLDRARSFWSAMQSSQSPARPFMTKPNQPLNGRPKKKKKPKTHSPSLLIIRNSAVPETELPDIALNPPLPPWNGRPAPECAGRAWSPRSRAPTCSPGAP